MEDHTLQTACRSIASLNTADANVADEDTHRILLPESTEASSDTLILLHARRCELIQPESSQNRATAQHTHIYGGDMGI